MDFLRVFLQPDPPNPSSHKSRNIGNPTQKLQTFSLSNLRTEETNKKTWIFFPFVFIAKFKLWTFLIEFSNQVGWLAAEVVAGRRGRRRRRLDPPSVSRRGLLPRRLFLTVGSALVPWLFSLTFWLMEMIVSPSLSSSPELWRLQCPEPPPQPVCLTHLVASFHLLRYRMQVLLVLHFWLWNMMSIGRKKFFFFNFFYLDKKKIWYRTRRGNPARATIIGQSFVAII